MIANSLNRSELEAGRDGCPVCDAPVSCAAGAVQCAGCGAKFRQTADGLLGAFGASDGIAYPEDGAELTGQVEETSFWFRHRNAVLDLLLDRFAPPGTLWDVGGGNGFQARNFQQQGRPVVLVEPGETGCRTARRRGVRRIVRATLESLQLPSDRVAAMSLFDVIEHLAEPARVLTECARVLRPGGRLYVTVPAYPFLWSDEDRYACHQRRYTRAGLARDLRAAGFSPEYISYYFQILVVPILLLRTVPYRLVSWRRDYRVPTMDQGEHAPGGLLQRALEACLQRELAAIRRGRRLRYGSSLVAVAVKP